MKIRHKCLTFQPCIPSDLVPACLLNLFSKTDGKKECICILVKQLFDGEILLKMRWPQGRGEGFFSYISGEGEEGSLSNFTGHMHQPTHLNKCLI